jgi:DNA repair protein RadC
MKTMKNWRAIIGGSEFKVMRLAERSPGLGTVLDTPQLVFDYLSPKLPESLVYRPDVENLMVVHMNTRRRPIGWEVISTGSLDTLLAHAREVFKSAILMNSSSIVIAHNHPSGDPTPSQADVKVTRDLIRAGQLLKIELTDHIVMGHATLERSKPYASLRELGYFFS